MQNSPICKCAVVFVVLFASGCNQEPFELTQASGKLVYDDGSPIPFDGIVLTFISQTPPKDPKTYPKPGMTVVDKDTGAFSSINTRKSGDGLTCGKHKVLVTGLTNPIPASIVPPEYADYNRTPLLVDTANQPFELKVRKPAGR